MVNETKKRISVVIPYVGPWHLIFPTSVQVLADSILILLNHFMKKSYDLY